MKSSYNVRAKRCREIIDLANSTRPNLRTFFVDATRHINHNPFPRDPVYIVGVEDEVEVMQSLQRPKKISLRGSDGKLYVFLCKPQDDLRKDFR